MKTTPRGSGDKPSATDDLVTVPGQSSGPMAVFRSADAETKDSVLDSDDTALSPFLSFVTPRQPEQQRPRTRPEPAETPTVESRSTSPAPPPRRERQRETPPRKEKAGAPIRRERPTEAPSRRDRSAESSARRDRLTEHTSRPERSPAKSPRTDKPQDKTPRLEIPQIISAQWGKIREAAARWEQPQLPRKKRTSVEPLAVDKPVSEQISAQEDPQLTLREIDNRPTEDIKLTPTPRAPVATALLSPSARTSGFEAPVRDLTEPRRVPRHDLQPIRDGVPRRYLPKFTDRDPIADLALTEVAGHLTFTPNT
ncbi:MAG: hypothetical protein H0T78_03990, partial [Longispora sp.]|nr:hypothetical protein [Longispora sp. (in: high G+C Gram-positive bacteria)]